MDNIIGADGAPVGAGLGAGAPAAGDLIKDSDTTNFGRDVIEASMAVPVIVDFWAPWCGPCKQLGPLLEKTVQAARGAVRLVKIDIDQNQVLAGQLRIQSIPAVYAFFQGQPVDGFVGAQSESQVKAFVERLARQSGQNVGPSPVEQALEKANDALEAKQFAAASALFGQILQHEPEHEEARAGMIRCHLESGDIEGARAMLEAVPEAQRAKPALASVAAAMELAESAAEAGPVGELRAKAEADPGDHQARFDLATALHAAGEREAAAEALLEIVKRNRKWDDEAARKQLVKYFEAWGPSDPLPLQVRRQLSTLLFS